MVITSETNRTVKWLESLRIKKFRMEHKVFLAEGERLVKDGAKYLQPEQIVLSEHYFHTKGYDGPIDPIVLSDKLFLKLSNTVNPQGIMAVFPIVEEDVRNLELAGGILLLNRIMDPGNMGTMIRTAEAAGFSSIVVDKGCVDVFNPKVVRSTMSALFRVHICFEEDLCRTIERLKPTHRIYAADYNASAVSVFQAEFPKKTAVIIGNEANGIDKNVLKKADQVVYIPMQGHIESLNASVSAAIVMYEHFRQTNLS